MAKTKWECFEYYLLKQQLLNCMGAGKPRGIRAGRKLATKRRLQKWNDKEYNARLLGSRFKNPFMGSCMAKGLVVEKIGVESKQPNSAVRKGVRVMLKKNGKKVAAFVPWDGCLNYLAENDEVLVAGFGKKGKSKGDIPGIRFKVVGVKGISLVALFKGKKEKK